MGHYLWHVQQLGWDGKTKHASLCHTIIPLLCFISYFGDHSLFTTIASIKSYFLLSSPSIAGMSNLMMPVHTSNKQPSKLLKKKEEEKKKSIRLLNL